jgi:hypothetical protein
MVGAIELMSKEMGMKEFTVYAIDRLKKKGEKFEWIQSNST